jgi:hypothetical protein
MGFMLVTAGGSKKQLLYHRSGGVWADGKKSSHRSDDETTERGAPRGAKPRKWVRKFMWVRKGEGEGLWY